MALIYLTKNVEMETEKAMIRKLEDDGDYAVAVTWPDGDDEVEIGEVLFTKDEVAEMYDVLFN
jgi:hypothetical protein